MRVVGNVPLWVECVFRRIDVVCLSLVYTQLIFRVRCLLYVSLELRVSPSILGLMCMGSVMLSMCSSSCVLHSAGSGMKREHAVCLG